MQGFNIVENPSWGMRGNYGGYPSGYAMVNSQSNCYGESYGYDRMAGKTRGQYNNSPYGTHYQTRILAEVPLLTDQRVASGPSNGHGHRHCHERYPHRRRRRHKSRDGQSYGHGYGQLHGNGYGHSYGQSYGHGYGQSHGQSHGQNYDGEESYCVLYACSEKLLQCRDGDRERLRKLTTLLPRDRDRNGGSDSESGSGSECGSDSESGSGSDCD